MIFQAVILLPVFLLYVIKVTCFAEKGEELDVATTDESLSDTGSDDEVLSVDASSDECIMDDITQKLHELKEKVDTEDKKKTD